MKITLAIDPSIRSCGWAYFEGRKLLYSDTIKCEAAFPIAAHFVFHKLLAKVTIVDALAIEYPQYERSMRGKVSMLQGHPLNLAYLAGCIASRIEHTTLYLPTPPQWKGQVPKSVTQARLKAKGYKFNTDDEADAIALGLWAINQRVNS